jgi:hypothetical protein
MTAWQILGFSADDVIAAEQDTRLAAACVRARRAEGSPADFEILQTAGEGNYFLFWYVNPRAAEILDRHQVMWRCFIVGNCGERPGNATEALSENARGRP